MSKDPAFLMYSKDWIEGTAELMPEEKGVYIDLLCYQHQRGFLTSDPKRLAKMVGISLDDFSKIWSVISCKFYEKDGIFLNKRLDFEIKERQEKGQKNKIIGIFASLLRTGNYSKKVYKLIKAAFNVNDFTIPNTEQSTERITERITEWLLLRLKSIEDGDEDGDEDEVEVECENVDYNFFVEQYHSFCPNMTQVKVMNKTRKGYINARIKEFGVEKIVEVLSKAGRSDFLNGNNANRWKADFEWIIRPENFVKVLEGKYDNKKPTLAV